jgi:prophage regulatory protein
VPLSQPETRLLRQPDVRKKYPLGRTRLYENIANGLFPKPVRLGARAVAWPNSEVDAVIAALIAGSTEDEIRALVQRLQAARRISP